MEDFLWTIIAQFRKDNTNKYIEIRRLDSWGIRWDMEIIKEVEEHSYSPDFERFYVIQYTRDGHDLTNMNHNDAKQRMDIARQVKDPNIKTVSDVGRQRKLHEKNKEKKLKYKIFKKELKENGIPSVKNCRFMPEYLKAGLLKWSQGHDCSIQAGMPINSLEYFASEEGIQNSKIIDDIARRIQQDNESGN